MKKKLNGFTIIELMITLAITTLTLGVIYTFFFSSNKILATTGAGLDLQTEGELIQKELVELGTQAKELLFINGNEVEKIKYDSLNNKELNITSLQIKLYDDVIYNLKLENNELKIQNESEVDIKVLSKNVKGVKVKPLDINMVNKNEATFKDAPGLEVTVDLGIKKGYTDQKYISREIVKFRNK